MAEFITPIAQLIDKFIEKHIYILSIHTEEQSRRIRKLFREIHPKILAPSNQLLLDYHKCFCVCIFYIIYIYCKELYGYPGIKKPVTHVFHWG